VGGKLKGKALSRFRRAKEGASLQIPKPAADKEAKGSPGSNIIHLEN